MSESFLVIAPPAVPAGNGTAILWDSTYGLLGTPVLATPGPYRRTFNRHFMRGQVTIFADQPVTFFCRALANSSTTWRAWNNGGAGEVAAASTYFQRDVYLQGDDSQLYILAGATPPTTWEITIRLRADPALGQ